MCGIVGYWATDSAPSPLAIKKLLEYGEKRGTDAFGYSIYNKNLVRIENPRFMGTVNKKFMSSHITKNIEKGSILLANFRAAPETEPESKDDRSIQPVSNPTGEYCLVHNGSISRKIYNELLEENTPNTVLDSEAIIWAYRKFGNMKATMEYLSGGFAFLMLDRQNRKLFAVCTHNPLYCGFVKGYGLFLSSFSEAIYETISIVKGCEITRQNIMVWEDYYCREFPSNTITEFNFDNRAIE